MRSPSSNASSGEPTVLLRLPDDLRDEFKEPFGPVVTDPRELLDRARGPVVAIGDVVTYHLVEAGRTPDIAVLDGYTERTPVGDAVREGTGEYGRRMEVRNPAATLTAETLDALAAVLSKVETRIAGDPRDDDRSGSIESAEKTVIDVDGEEDLCTLPAIAVAPGGTTVVYGQPGEGMVHVTVDEASRTRAHELIERMDGDHERAWELLGISGQ